MYFILVEYIEIFYLPPMIKIANSKFILAIKGPKLARRGDEIKKIYMAKSREQFLHSSLNGAIRVGVN